MEKLLDEDLVALGLELPDWETAVAHGSELLLRKGRVKEGYREKLIQREQEYPTGLQGKVMGIAVPHTSADYTLQPAICVLIPSKPVPFRAMEDRETIVQARLIFQLAITGGGMQLALLRRIMKLLRDDLLLCRLLQAQKRGAVLALLRPVLEG